MDPISLLRAQYKNLPIATTRETCEGNTYIITGSNGGIGLEAVKHLVNVGAARVIIAVRSLTKGNEAKALVDASTGRPEATEVWQLDMASFDSIRAFARKAIKELTHIHGLVENATAALDTWTISEGMETSVAVNVVGTVLLALLLLPKLKEMAKVSKSPPQIVVVTSGLGFGQESFLQYAGQDIFQVLNEEGKSDMNRRYSVTKLVQIFAVRQLASLAPYSETGVVINYLNPGLCNTGLARYGRIWLRIQVYLLNVLMGRTPEMGSRTILHSMVAGPESHGEYVSDCEIKDHWVPEWAKGPRGREFQAQVWDQLTPILEKIEPGVISTIRD
ncbi:Short chain dehydrogenase atnD [Colletotrichum spinosum]|uniref:Short chain dehydrogenase atnD n=1 Tax=Colletotrichum spinosum TaxID=1347390 RepID=A0A4R8QM66_9PEZI|nr:Short chain dehydrogenase atnD [Colletotrichum spinosum]